MNKLIAALLTAMVVLFSPLSASAAELSTKQVDALKEVSTKIAVVHELATRNIINADVAKAAEEAFLQDAKQVVGHDVTAQEVETLVSNAAKTEGLGTFWNIVVVVAGILFLLAVVALIAFYLRDILAQIPPVGYELAAYAGTFVMILAGYFWQPFHLGFVMVNPLWFVIPGALALAGCIFLSHALHFKGKGKGSSDRVYMGPGFFNLPTVIFAVCTIVWGAMAIGYSHLYPDAGIPHVLAFAAVIALQAFLGFSVLTMPGCIALGWTEEKQVPKSVFSSLIILATYVVLKLTGALSGDLALFETGAIFMGAFVYYLGLLVMSSKWYEKGERYALINILTIVSGIAALYLGATFGIGALLGVGGTLFAIYGLEKYYEIPWKGIGWAWSLLGVAGLLYGIVAFASANPQYFVWGIK